MSIHTHHDSIKVRDGDISSRELVVNEDGSVNAVITDPVDSTSGYAIFLNPEHHRVHLSQGFSATAVLSNISAGSSIYIEIICASGKMLDTQSFNIISDRMIKSEFFEDCVCTNGTEEIPLVNRRRAVPNSASSKIYTNPTNITNNGNLLRTLVFGDSGSNKSIQPLPSNPMDSMGFNLRPGKYILKLTNISTDVTSIVFFNLDLYEYGDQA